MDAASANKFRDNLKQFIEQVIHDHSPLKVTRRDGDDFVVVSVEDWARKAIDNQLNSNPGRLASR